MRKLLPSTTSTLALAAAVAETAPIALSPVSPAVASLSYGKLVHALANSALPLHVAIEEREAGPDIHIAIEVAGLTLAMTSEVVVRPASHRLAVTPPVLATETVAMLVNLGVMPVDAGPVAVAEMAAGLGLAVMHLHYPRIGEAVLAQAMAA